MCAMSNPLEHKTVTSPRGTTHYWIAKHDDPAAPVLVFLPGLSADHRLFDEQTAHFPPHCTVLVWDAPAHGLSRPYQDFSYRNLAGELLRILDAEALPRAVLVGQSAGGFVAQSLIAHSPQRVAGLFTIGTCPYDPVYYSRSDLLWLRQTRWMFGLFPEKTLRNAMADACAVTAPARQSMLDMQRVYNKKELCRLMYLGLAGFIPEMQVIDFPCPVMLTVGEHDRTGKVRQYNEAWHRRGGYPLHIIPGASHNANADRPDLVDSLLEGFLEELPR